MRKATAQGSPTAKPKGSSGSASSASTRSPQLERTEQQHVHDDPGQQQNAKEVSAEINVPSAFILKLEHRLPAPSDDSNDRQQADRESASDTASTSSESDEESEDFEPDLEQLDVDHPDPKAPPTHVDAPAISATCATLQNQAVGLQPRHSNRHHLAMKYAEDRYIDWCLNAPDASRLSPLLLRWLANDWDVLLQRLGYQ